MEKKIENDQNASDIILRAVEIITAARTGSYAETAALLNRFLQSLQKILSSDSLSINDLSKITYSLETLAEMQKMENWVAFADILEYEFVPLWKDIMKIPG